MKAAFRVTLAMMIELLIEKLRLRQGRLTLALPMGLVPRNLRADISSVPSFSLVRQAN